MRIYLDHGLSSGIFLGKGVLISFYLKKQSGIALYYSVDGDLVYCKN
jgi:hypothetical protein